MRVRDLMDKLAECDPDDVVVLAADQEGNSFDTLGYVDPTHAWDETSYEIGLRTLTQDDVRLGYTEEDLAPPGAVDCVILWP